MSFSNELLAAAERTMHAAGAKPKDVVSVLTRLCSAEYQFSASVDGGLLSLTQHGQPVNLGVTLAAYRSKFPRDFYGEAGEVKFKDDLAGDLQAKSRFIREHGLAAWDALPVNEKSPGARHVVNAVIPSAGMRRSEYLQLSISERTKLAGEVGAAGIERIMGRR